MSIADRALRAFETELLKHLSFAFTALRSVDPAGQPRTRLRVWMRNNSNIVLTEVRGSICPADGGSFPYTTFHVDRLPPAREVEVARIEAKLGVPAEPRFALDGIATVNVSGSVDLTGFRFKEAARGLTYVAARLAQDGVDSVAPADGSSVIALDWGKLGKRTA
jgi:hypothetical protein